METIIKQAFNLFQSIGETTSRTQKEAYLKEGEANGVFKSLLKLCYDPFQRYHIKKVPVVAPSDLEGGPTDLQKYEDFVKLLFELTSRMITGNDAVLAVSEFLSLCDTEEQKWYTKVLQKDLKIGITDTTINKVFKKWIPTYSCMLAHPIAKDKYPKRFSADAKMDGNRCNGWVHPDGRVELLSRNGLPIEGYTEIEQELSQLPWGYIYDGEIMSLSGSFSDTQKEVRKKGVTDKKGMLYLFDMVSIEEFQAGKGTTSYEKRIQLLDSIEETILDSNSLTILRREIFEDNSQDSIDRVAKMHSEFLMRGYEGTMIKDLDAVYECKKGRAIQKLKDFYTIDLTVIAVEPGEPGTKYESVLGALVVELKDTDILDQLPEEQHIFVSGGVFPVNVGSGYSDSQRADLWGRRADLINRTIEIKFWNVSLNEKGQHSLRFPVFTKFREDK